MLCAIIIGWQGIAAAGMKPASPFYFYSAADGLSQRFVQAFAQDHQGFLWLATWSGLNRFDGTSFKRLSVLDGLRVNGATALLVDPSGRLWVGDSGGGLSVVQYGRVTRIIEPNTEAPTPVRSLYILGEDLYVGYQANGLGRLNLSNPDASIELLPGAPKNLVRIITAPNPRELLLQTLHGGLFRYLPSTGTFDAIDADVTALKQSHGGRVYVGNKLGHVGQWRDGDIEWLYQGFGTRVLDIALRGETPVWVSTATHISPFDQPDERIPVVNAGRLLLDRDGVLWTISSAGLGRYLGNRFDHFPLEQEGVDSLVFAIRRDDKGRRFFATSTGLLISEPDGAIISASDRFGVPRCELRDLQLSRDQSKLWLGCLWNNSLALDLATMKATPVFASNRHAILDLELDELGWLWAGTARGEVLAEQTQTGAQRRYQLGVISPVYSMALDSDQQLWVSVYNQGIFRLDTRAAVPEPELVLTAEQLGDTSAMHINAEAHAGGDGPIWLGTSNGRVLALVNGQISRAIELEQLADQTVYVVHPVPGGALIIGTERGLYRYYLDSGQFEQYGASEGYVGVETKNHASFLENQRKLWLGTGAGATLMDLTVDAEIARMPPPSIVAVVTHTGDWLPLDQVPLQSNGQNLTVEFASVTTRRGAGVRYSHQLVGASDDWSRPSELTAVTFPKLPPGEFTFRIRAQRPGELWTEPTELKITVPTPVWMTAWFRIALAVVGLGLIVLLVKLRTLQVEQANKRLQSLVDERTRSIEAARERLRQTNIDLTNEVDIRRAAEIMRDEMEARFTKAYENAPLGMGMVDINGNVFDANPPLMQWFWPDFKTGQKKPLTDVVAPQQQEELRQFLHQFSLGNGDDHGVEFECDQGEGNPRQFLFFLSPIQDNSGALRYGLLMAQDVTESRELTRKLAHQAAFDEMTGLRNRRSFQSELNRICHEPLVRSSCLLYMDLDGFKNVNDTCGHHAGDELLIQVSGIIRNSLRSSDFVARLGGDEFAAIMPECDRAIAEQKAEVIRSRIEQLQFTWAEITLTIGISIGYVMIDGSVFDIDKLQSMADDALYAAKRAGRNRVVFGGVKAS